MPHWNQPSRTLLRSSLNTVIEGLEAEVSDDPSFEQVTGITMEEMVQNAAEAIAAFVKTHEHEQVTGPDALMKCYIMGFIVGTKFQAQRSPNDKE